MAFDVAKYSIGPYPFPKDEIDPKEKNELWAKKYCEAIYSNWRQGRSAIPYRELGEIQKLREVADGRQDVLQYQKILLDISDPGQSITGYMNINWDIPAVMPKFLRVVEGIMEQTEHQVVATAIDPASTSEKEEAKLDMTFRMRYKNQIEQIEKALGIDNSSMYVPETIEELNLYEGAGGFKLAKEIEIEQGLDYSFYISDWKDIKRRLIRDALVINMMCVKDYVDPYTKKVKVRYVDPAKFIGQYSNHWDHWNMEYAGEIIQVLISDLRKQTTIPESELRLLAQSYESMYGNIHLSTYDFYDETQTSDYDTFLVDVLDCEWNSVDSKYMTTRTNKFGNEVVYESEWGKVYNTDKRKTEKYDIKNVYRCKWVIGTDYIYDFGLQYDVPRPGRKETSLSFHFFHLPYRSIVSLCETYIDQFVLTFFRLQNAIAKARPAGIAVEYTSLQNMSLGGKKLEPSEILKIATQTGDLIYKATTYRGIPNVPGGFRPITELTGGIGAQLNEFIVIFNYCLDQIRQVTGINQIADASTPNPEQSVGGSQLAIVATNNALRPIYSAYITCKEVVAKNLSLRMQLLIKHDKEAYKGYMPAIGNIGVQLISVETDVIDVYYCIKYEARPTLERKEVIKQAAIKALSPDRDGIVGIELADFLMIERLLENGSLKYAEAYLNYKTRKNRDRQLQLQRENMEINKQKELERDKQAFQIDIMKKKQESDEELRVYEAKKMIDEKYKQLEHERTVEKIGTQSALDIVKKQTEQNILT